MTGALLFSIEGEGVRLTVRVTPRAGRDAIGGLVQLDERTALQVRLAAAPVDGAANKALIALVAAALDIRKSDVELVSGDSSRVKLLRLNGDPGAILPRLSALIQS